MSILGKFTKQPREIETYSISYKEDLTSGDEITTVDASVVPSEQGGLELFNISHDENRVRVWVRNGVASIKYKIEVTASTMDGRVMQDEFYVAIKEY